MANTNTPQVAASVASPATVSEPKQVKASPLVCSDTVSWTGTTANDTLLLCRLPINASIHKIEIQTDDLGGAGQTFDLGFYQTNADITAIDADALASDIAVASATSVTNYRFSVKGHTTINDRVYTLAGLSDPPEYGEVYLAMTVATADTAIAGDVSFYCEYTL